MPRALDASERAAIVEAIRDGGKRNELARRFRRSPSTIPLIAQQAGLEFDRSATKRATEVRHSYAQDERLELLNEGFDRARELLPTIDDAGELQKWTTALGTMIDKRRLEEGGATSREEMIDPERRKKIRKSLDELAAFRSQRGPGEALE